METAQSRQKSYADVRRRPLEFEIGDKVFLKVAPMRGVMRFGKKGKLSPRYIGPFEILERVGTVEGYYAVAAVCELAEKYGVSMPISEQCYDILYNGTPPMKAAVALMTRPERSEEETIDIK